MSKAERTHPSFEASSFPRQKRSDLIVDQIKRWIVDNTMQPGDSLPREKELTEKIGVSRGTAREALRALEFQGLIEITPGAGGGARIASISHEQASQLLRNFFYFANLSWAQVYEVRELLEPSLAASAVGRLTDDQVERLNNSIATCKRRARSDRQVREVRTAELEFHRVLAEACPSPLLQFICNFVNDLLVDFALYKDVIEPYGEQFRQDNVAAHVELMDAYVREDANAVEQLMRTHVHHAGCFVTAQEGAVENSLLL